MVSVSPQEAPAEKTLDTRQLRWLINTVELKVNVRAREYWYYWFCWKDSS